MIVKIVISGMGWERVELSTSGYLKSYETYALANCAITPNI